MALGRRGQDRANVERTLHEHPEPKGHWIADDRFLQFGDWMSLAQGLAGLEQIRAAIRTPASVIVTVIGPRWVAGLPYGTSSQHGALCAPGTWGGPIHSVMVVDWEGDTFFVLDPFFSDSNQPFEATDDEMIQSLTGHALVVRLN